MNSLFYLLIGLDVLAVITILPVVSKAFTKNKFVVFSGEDPTNNIVK